MQTGDAMANANLSRGSMIRALLAGLLITACKPDRVDCDFYHFDEGVLIPFPCEAAYRGFDSTRVELRGEACGRAEGVQIFGKADGSCVATARFMNGASQEYSIEFSHREGHPQCGGPYYAGTIQAEGTLLEYCSDAGFCANQQDCFTSPSMSSCTTRCKVADLRGCGVQTAGWTGDARCATACACGAGDQVNYVDGCTADSDCVLVPADCCGCQRGGSSVAIQSALRDGWTKALAVDCPDSPLCAGADRCGAPMPSCSKGRCVALTRDAGL